MCLYTHPLIQRKETAMKRYPPVHEFLIPQIEEYANWHPQGVVNIRGVLQEFCAMCRILREVDIPQDAIDGLHRPFAENP